MLSKNNRKLSHIYKGERHPRNGFRNTIVMFRLPSHEFGISSNLALSNGLWTKYQRWALMYLDDIIIASNSVEDHAKHLAQIFYTVATSRPHSKTRKMFLWKKRNSVLRIQINSVRREVRQFENGSSASCAEDITRFIGMTFYQKFIQNSAELAQPLQKRKRKRVNFVRTSETQDAYKKI